MLFCKRPQAGEVLLVYHIQRGVAEVYKKDEKKINFNKVTNLNRYMYFYILPS